MALTGDVYIVRYGVPGDAHQLANQPLGANVTVYRGSIALTDSAGNIKNAASPASTDTCWGIIDTGGPGYPNFTPGVANASTVAGAVTVDILTGTFYLASGAGSDLLSQSAIGQTVYVINETTVGLTSGGGSRPKAGTLFFIDPAPPPTALGAFAVKMVQGGP